MRSCACLLFALSILFIFGLGSAQATIINIDDNNDDISDAIQGADDGDTVLVAPGTYTQFVHFNGEDVVLASRYILTGDEDDIDNTILSGNGSFRVLQINQGESRDAMVIGFTVRDGRSSNGSGMFINNSDPTISHCRFIGHETDNFGGVVKARRSDPLFEYCTFEDNSGRHGGAIYADRCDLEVYYCRFENNESDFGGAIKIDESDLIAEHCDFVNNESEYGGAFAAFDDESESYFERCTFLGNHATGGGGAVKIADDGEHEWNFCTFTGNTTDGPNQRSAFYCHSGAEIELRNTIVWGNGTGDGDEPTMDVDDGFDIEYCDIEWDENDWDEDWDDDGNFSEDPEFVDEDNLDVHLTAGSPCIDAGDPDEDNDDDGTRADIGAYPYEQQQYGTLINVPDDIGTIQGAIHVASDGDTIIVDQGTYEENIDFGGTCVVLTSNWLFTGDEDDIANTIITGADGSPVVTYDSGEGEECQLIGFTITNDNEGTSHGGGVYIHDSSPTIDHCWIHGIDLGANLNGGGVWAVNSNSEFRYCRIWDNSAAVGGAFFAGNANLSFYRCWIYGNSAGSGGAFWVDTGCNIDLEFTLIYRNTAVQGGAFYCREASVDLLNCTMSNNTAEDDGDDGEGGGFYIDTEVDIYWLNCIMWNDAPEEFFCSLDGEGSSISGSFSDIEGGFNGVVNRQVADMQGWIFQLCLDEDPLFVDGDNDDYHLTEDSPCIDQGHPNSDPDPDGTRADQGALYFIRQNIYSNYYYGGGWWMISMSVFPFDNGKDAIFWDDLTRSYDVFDFEYDRGFESVDELFCGPGYWFGAEDTVIFLDVMGEELDDTVSFDLQVPWNMVGTPFLHTYEMDEVFFRHDGTTLDGEEAVDEDWISPVLYTWRHEWFEYRTFDYFEPWTGYWLMALVEDMEILFPPPGGQVVASHGEAGRDGVDGSGSANEWFVNLDVSLGESGNARVRFGAQPDATDDYDNIYDYPAPIGPPEGATIRAYFVHEAWHPQAGDNYARDIRSPYAPEELKEWQITVLSMRGEEVIISWPVLPFTAPPEDFTFMLIDRSNGEQVNMLEQDSYSFQSDSTNLFVIRTQSFNAVSDPGFETQPTHFDISSIYPNPFNNETVIHYTVPRDNRVSVTVHDMLGRRVRTLVSGNHIVGRHTATWNAGDASNGLYFIKMTYERGSTIRKVMLVK